MLVQTFWFSYLCCWFSKTATKTISLKVFLSLLEHLLSKSGGDCTFIHQFIECQSEYRVFFTLILIKSGSKLKNERKNEDLHVFVMLEVHKGRLQTAVILYILFLFLVRKVFLLHLLSQMEVSISCSSQKKKRSSFKLFN